MVEGTCCFLPLHALSKACFSNTVQDDLNVYRIPVQRLATTGNGMLQYRYGHTPTNVCPQFTASSICRTLVASYKAALLMAGSKTRQLGPKAMHQCYRYHLAGIRHKTTAMVSWTPCWKQGLDTFNFRARCSEALSYLANSCLHCLHGSCDSSDNIPHRKETSFIVKKWTYPLFGDR